MLDASLTAADPWTALDELAADPPGGAAALAADVGERYERATAKERRFLTHLLGLLREDGDPVVLDLLARGGDRKSTRLNSSHLVISYAVFCLKKKSKYTLPPVDGVTAFIAAAVYT